MSRKKVYGFAAVILMFGVAFGAWKLFGAFGGRSASRLGGRDYAQELKLEHLQSVADIISISFDRRGDNTVKDVTYRAMDGYIYTREFKDASAFEGVIRWVPFGQQASFIQSRALSRWGGGAVDLELPEDCMEVLNVDIGYAGSDQRVKNLVYRAIDGQVWAKEYREGVVDRHMSGWARVSGTGGDQ